MITLSSAPVLFAQATPSPGSPSMLILIIMLFGLMYFGLIRPQLREQKAQKAMLANLKRGDEVVTSGGILGRILVIDEKIVTLDIGGGTKLRVLKQSLQARVNTEAAKPETSKPEAEAPKDEKPK